MMGAFETVTRNRDELVVQGDLQAEVASQLNPQIARLEMLVRELTRNPPIPQVTVQAPQVTVQQDAPDLPELSVSLPGMDRLQAEIALLRADMATLTSVLLRPTVRSVERDSNGYITRITESR